MRLDDLRLGLALDTDQTRLPMGGRAPSAWGEGAETCKHKTSLSLGVPMVSASGGLSTTNIGFNDRRVLSQPGGCKSEIREGRAVPSEG